MCRSWCRGVNNAKQSKRFTQCSRYDWPSTWLRLSPREGRSSRPSLLSKPRKVQRHNHHKPPPIGAPTAALGDSHTLLELPTPTTLHSLATMLLRTTLARAPKLSATVGSRHAIRSPAAACLHQQKRYQQHAISNPTLANIEQRWESMPPQEQADLWMALRDRMKKDWNEMTMQEKKAGMHNLLS